MCEHVYLCMSKCILETHSLESMMKTQINTEKEIQLEFIIWQISQTLYYYCMGSLYYVLGNSHVTTIAKLRGEKVTDINTQLRLLIGW